MKTRSLTGLLPTRVNPCVGGVLLSLCALLASAAPRMPANDTEVLEKLPTRAGDSTARELAGLRAAVARAPSDAGAATALAQRYFDLAIARGDPRYVGYADAVVGRFAQQMSPALLTLRGVLRQYRHDFAASLQDFAAALKLDPAYAEAHAWRAAIFLVQADYGSARTECAALQRLGRDSLAGGCLGLTQAYSGQLEAGYATLQAALSQARDDDNRLWILTRLGEVAAWRGQAAQARAHYQAAMALGRDDVYLLAAWSDFLLDAGDYAQVAQLLAPWESADSLLLRLAEAEHALKLPAAARHQQMMADRFAAARARGDTTHLAEEARFEWRLRQDARTALRLAQENYEVQREPRDALVVLEAAVAAKDGAGAQGVRDWLRRSGFEDARMRGLARATEQWATAGGAK
jgi:Tfp pilus assembly protein PilF